MELVADQKRHSAANKPRAEILQPRQFDLQLALVGTRTLREDLEDQEGPVVDGDFQSRSRLRCCAGLID